MEHIHIILANNPQDFDEPDILVAGKTKDAVNVALREEVVQRWNSMTPENKEFYNHNMENYYDAWKEDYSILPIHT